MKCAACNSEHLLIETCKTATPDLPGYHGINLVQSDLIPDDGNIYVFDPDALIPAWQDLGFTEAKFNVGVDFAGGPSQSKLAFYGLGRKAGVRGKTPTRVIVDEVDVLGDGVLRSLGRMTARRLPPPEWCDLVTAAVERRGMTVEWKQTDETSTVLNGPNAGLRSWALVKTGRGQFVVKPDPDNGVTWQDAFAAIGIEVGEAPE